MSQASHSSTFTACGELGPDEAIEKIFGQRRRTGGHLEYNCDLCGDSEPRWLAAAAVDAASLSAWEIVRATNLRAEQEGRKRDARKRKRDEKAAMIVHTFKESAIGKLFLSQKINTRSNAGPNRKSDCENALKRMRSDDFKLYEIRSSSVDQQTSDAVTAGKAIGELADGYDFIGQHSFMTASFRSGGKIPPQPTFARIIRVEGRRASRAPNLNLLRQAGQRGCAARCGCLHPRRQHAQSGPQHDGAACHYGAQQPFPAPCRPRAKAVKVRHLTRAPRVHSCC